MVSIYPEVNSLKHLALLNFTKQFEENATICVYAPGRVNLIGEHTDYNEGFVLPMALPMVTMIVGKSNNTKICKIITMSDDVGIKKTCEFRCGSEISLESDDPKWSYYIKGCIAKFPKSLTGFNAMILSTVPVGAGLSSSAALEVAMYTFLESITKHRIINPIDKVLICQCVEHEFAGVSCGIMDQFISVMGLNEHALLLDCRDLVIKQIPIREVDDNIFLIINSNTPHKLSSSAYNERKTCCYEVARLLGKKSLREANISDLKVLNYRNVCDIAIKRARHVITEIQRTLEAATCLEKNNFIRFGELMNESHDSLRDDYEVSSKELDILVTIARSIDGVMGSRLTGAGFGGCTITLLKKKAIDILIKTVQEKYPGIPSFYIAKPSIGARELQIISCSETID